MLELTQETLWRVERLLDAGDTESAGKLLLKVDSVSLRAVILHILKDRGKAAADPVGAAYLGAAWQQGGQSGTTPACSASP